MLGMTSVEVYFMGGPCDGQYRAVEVADPMRPPSVQYVFTPPDLRFSINDLGAPVEPTKHEYGLQVSQLDDGPAWVYAYRGTVERQA